MPRDEALWFQVACRLRRQRCARLGVVGVGNGVDIMEVASCLARSLRHAGAATIVTQLGANQDDDDDVDGIVLIARVGHVTEGELIAQRWEHDGKILGVLLLADPLRERTPRRRSRERGSDPHALPR